MAALRSARTPKTKLSLRVLAGLLIVLMAAVSGLAPLARAHELTHLLLPPAPSQALVDSGSSTLAPGFAHWTGHEHGHQTTLHDTALGDALHAFAHTWLGCTASPALLPAGAVELTPLGSDQAPPSRGAEVLATRRIDTLLRPPIA